MPKVITITQHERCEVPTNKGKRNALYTRYAMTFPENAEKMVERWEAYTGTPFEFDSVTTLNLDLFKRYCLEDGLAASTVDKHCRHLSAVLRKVCEDKRVSSTAFRDTLKCKHTQRKGEFATVNDDDIDKVIRYYQEAGKGLWRNVSALMLMEYFTGARISDTGKFDLSNLKDITYIDKATMQPKTRKMINYVSQKTRVNTSIPVKPIIDDILHDDMVDTQGITTAQIDRCAKIIFRQLGLTRPIIERRGGKQIARPLSDAVSSHTFRRSFATNLYEKGVPIDTIRALMGHTNMTQTLRYIQSNVLLMDAETMEIFD